MQRLIVAADADGCIYNKNYHWILRYLMFNFHKAMWKFIQGAELPNQHMQKIMQTSLLEALEKIKCHLARHETQHCAELDLAQFISTDAGSELLKNLANKYQLSFTDENIETLLIMAQNYCHDFLQVFAPELNGAIVCLSNQVLLDYLQNMAEDYNEIVFSCFSLRQSPGVDQAGKQQNATGLIFVDLMVLAQELQKRLGNKIPVRFEPCHMANFYKVANINLAGKDWLPDPSKFSIFYAFNHYFAQKFSDGFNNLLVLDDREELLQSLQSIPTHRLPENNACILQAYDGKLSALKPENSIHGSGQVHTEYMLFLAKLYQTRQRIKPNQVQVDFLKVFNQSQSGYHPQCNIFEFSPKARFKDDIEEKNYNAFNSN